MREVSWDFIRPLFPMASDKSYYTNTVSIITRMFDSIGYKIDGFPLELLSRPAIQTGILEYLLGFKLSTSRVKILQIIFCLERLDKVDSDGYISRNATKKWNIDIPRLIEIFELMKRKLEDNDNQEGVRERNMNIVDWATCRKYLKGVYKDATDPSVKIIAYLFYNGYVLRPNTFFITNVDGTGLNTLDLDTGLWIIMDAKSNGARFTLPVSICKRIKAYRELFYNKTSRLAVKTREYSTYFYGQYNATVFRRSYITYYVLNHANRKDIDKLSIVLGNTVHTIFENYLKLKNGKWDETMLWQGSVD